MTLNKKLLRSTKKNLSFYFTATLLTALTIMLWVGAFTVADTLTATYNRLFLEESLEDACFTVSREIPEQELSMLESEYSVLLEKQMYKNVTYGEKRLRVFADMDKLDRTYISEGEALSADMDVLITYNFAKASGISIGDDIELDGKIFNVCGYCLKPDYAAMYAEFSDTFPDSKNFGIAVIGKDALQADGGYSSYYSVRFNDQNKEESFRRYIYKKYGTLQYTAQRDNPRTGALLLSADDLKAEFSVYSPVLMLVVVAVTAMVLSRTVRRDSKSIGTLMALGYSRRELTGHYIMYALIPSVFGVILGAVGSIPFAKLFCIYMFTFGEYIEYTPHIPPAILLIAVVIPPVVYCGTAILVIGRCMNDDVVLLLKGGGKGKISHALRTSKMKFLWLYNIRTVLANKGRSLTLLVGVTVATMAVMISGLYQYAYDDFLDNKVPKAMLGGQYEYGFTDFQRENPYGGYAILDVSFGIKGTENLFNLIGIEENCDLIEADTLSGEPIVYGGYYMTSAAARLYGYQKGDKLSFYNLLSMEESTITITDVIKNDVLSLVITSKANAASILHRDEAEYDVIISKTELDIPQEKLNKSASLDDYRNSSENAFRTATIVLYIVKVIGAMICVLVVVMLAGMIVEENRRSISLLDVLGYAAKEIRRLILSSNHLIVPLGFLTGVPLGIAISDMIASTNAQTSGMFMTIELTPKIFLTSLLFVSISYILSMLMAGIKLKKVDMVECLKEDRE
ncbi:MAG: FtsX-like permease family protein [Lachnospiraceae bacterium]|nr:FtsX-like permease family protein [Lachnospiraceae bacterium]